jgi:hypothetical protein
MSHIVSKRVRGETSLQDALEEPTILPTLLDCVLPAEVDSIATSLMFFYQMHSRSSEVLAPVIEHYLSSTGTRISVG